MGDFGTLFPLAMGYIVVCGMDPTGILLVMGLANITTGLVFRLPMPVEPMKVIAVVAIAQGWNPATIHSTGFATGIIWVVLAVSGLIGLLARSTPREVTRGIQVALGVMLCVEALKLASSWWLLGACSAMVILLLGKSRFFPAALVLVALGLGVMAFDGSISQIRLQGPTLPWVAFPSLSEAWQGMLAAGFAQLGLTAANAVIATSALISRYWPDRIVSGKSIALSTGIMNIISPLLGGMPMCHGSGGLAGQHAFGARTGGANIIEGVIEISLGILLGGTITALFMGFPEAILGAMMLVVGIRLTLFTRETPLDGRAFVFLTTVLVSVFTNMAFGLASGLLSSLILKKLIAGKRRAK